MVVVVGHVRDVSIYLRILKGVCEIQQVEVALAIIYQQLNEGIRIGNWKKGYWKEK